MNRLLPRVLTLLLGLMLALPAAFADDIEIYTNQTPNAARPPLTVLVLDTNISVNDVLCSNIITAAGVSCDQLRSTLSLGALLDLVSVNPATLQGAINLLPICGGLLLPACPQVNSLLTVNLSSIYSSVTYTLLKTVLDLTLSATQKTITTLKVYRSFLRKLIASLAVFRLAVMVSHNDHGTTTISGGQTYACNFADLASIPGARNQTTACSNGGYVLLGFVDLLNDVGGATLTTVLNKIDVLLNEMSLLGNVNHPFQGKEVYYELMRYLRGEAVYNGHLGYFDYADTDPVSNLNNSLPALSWDTSIESANQYRSALDQFGVCDSVNVLNVLLTNSQKDADSDRDLKPNYPTGDRDANGTLSFAELVAEAKNLGFSHHSSLVKLNSYFVINGASSDTTLLQNLGVSLSVLPNIIGLLGLGQTPAEFLQPVLSVNASLLTPSLTVDLTHPGQLRAESFFTEFKPALDQRPTWLGNLKKLELRSTSNQYHYYDSAGHDAIAADGRIRTDALTFWTNSAQLGNVSADGREAGLGGAGQKIPGFQFGGGGTPGRVNADNKRKLFYDSIAASTSVPSLAAFDADSTTVRTALQSSFGAANSTETQELMLYARGYDVGTSSASKGTGSGLLGRAWLHGAVLHSRPVAINYGARSSYTAADPDIRIVYGAADGWLRMVRNSGGTLPGIEQWAFMPQAVMGQQKTLRDDAPAGRFPYGVDGAPTVIVQDRSSTGGPADGKLESSNTNDRVQAYFGLRRGGAQIFALNLTDPDNPALMWRLGTDGLFNSSGLVASSTTHFSELGLTFSNPKAGRMSVTEGSSTTTRRVLLFGGGYNGGRDSGNNRIGKDLARGSNSLVGSDDGRGNALYVVDADTGALIWKAKQGSFDSAHPYNSTSRTFLHPLLADSFPSEPTAVDSDGDGLIDRLYIADSGGRLWRADFPGADRSAWTVTPLASVGRHRSSSVANDRRFFHAPDYVPFRDANGAYDAVVFGSGDREDPLNTTTENFLYTYRDRQVRSGKTTAQIKLNESDLTGQDDFVDLTTACASGSTGCGASAQSAIGWKLKLGGRGEKALSQPVTTGGTVFFTSYLPTDPGASVCIPQEGVNRLYGVSLVDSRPTVQAFINDGDGNARSGDGSGLGLAGEVNTMATNSLGANTRTLDTGGRRYYDVYWRERRGDDETPP